MISDEAGFKIKKTSTLALIFFILAYIFLFALLVLSWFGLKDILVKVSIWFDFAALLFFIISIVLMLRVLKYLRMKKKESLEKMELEKNRVK
jgi:membrane protein implicated in regulation of membrane protease activity